jgi:hypothetical protein
MRVNGGCVWAVAIDCETVGTVPRGPALAAARRKEGEEGCRELESIRYFTGIAETTTASVPSLHLPA